MTLKLVSKLLMVAVIAFLLGFALGYEISKEGYTANMPAPASLLSTLAMNETIEAGIWRIAILSVEESLCIKYRHFYGWWEYYQAPKGMKVVIVRALVGNKGFKDSAPFTVGEPPGPGEFSLPILITNAGKKYKTITEYDIKSNLVEVRVLDEEILKCAIPFKGPFGEVSAGKSDEKDFMYLVPENEEPVKLVMVYQPTLNRPPITFEVSIRHK